MVVVLGFETITILSFRFKICLTQDGASRRRRQGRDNSGNDRWQWGSKGNDGKDGITNGVVAATVAGELVAPAPMVMILPKIVVSVPMVTAVVALAVVVLIAASVAMPRVVLVVTMIMAAVWLGQ